MIWSVSAYFTNYWHAHSWNMECLSGFLIKWKDIEAIQRVQKRATKQINQIRHLSYSDRLKKLNLPTLHYRRHRGDMTEVFKILHHIYDSDVCEGMLKLPDNKKTRGHSLNLHAQQSWLDVTKFSFAIWVVKPWNSLPEEVVAAPSFRPLKTSLVASTQQTSTSTSNSTSGPSTST